MNNPAGWLIIYQNGVDAAKAGNFQNAINSFSKCIDLDDKNPIVFILRSTAYYQIKEYEKALADIYRALALDQTIYDAYEQKALIEWSMGNLQVAIADYNKAVSINPNDSICFMNRGQVKRDSGDLDGAISDLEKSLELDPNNSLANQIFEFCQTMKQYPEVYKRSLEKIKKQ